MLAGWLEIKKSRFFFWRETVFQARINEWHPAPGQPRCEPMENVVLEPMSEPTEVECNVRAELPKELRDKPPRRSELWLVLEMVGPIRRLQRRIDILKLG